MDIEPVKKVRALSLLSGGLDSRLAIAVLREQGIEVHAIVFDNPFFNIAPAISASEAMNVPLHIVDFTTEIVSLLKEPKHGFGSCMNPCIDCHALMLKRAGEMMEDMGFDFLSTGEVLNQRPMSQNKRSLNIVKEDSGYEDFIVRPLSAQLLPATKTEKDGLVDRSRLLSLSGRGRKPQFALAEKYGVVDYPSPAGGCRLTEPNFSKRLKDLKEHEGFEGVHSLYRLRFGRHFRLNDKIKLIVGRNEHDNAVLEGNAELYDLILRIVDVPGPTALLPLTASEEEVQLAGAICAKYCDCPKDKTVVLRVRSSRGARELEVVPATFDDIEPLRI